MGESKVLASTKQPDTDLRLSGSLGLGQGWVYDILNKGAERYGGMIKSCPEDGTNRKNVESSNERPVLDLPDISGLFGSGESRKYSKRVQSWQGIVISQNEQSFKAKLFDMNAGGTYEIGEFENDDISPEDLTLFEEGAVFYWTVGHYMENGQSVKRSDLRFQRLITLDEEDIEIVKKNIENKYSNLKERTIDNV